MDPSKYLAEVCNSPGTPNSTHLGLQLMTFSCSTGSLVYISVNPRGFPTRVHPNGYNPFLSTAGRKTILFMQ